MTNQIRYIVRNASDLNKIGFGYATIHSNGDDLYIIHEGEKTNLYFDGYEWYVLI